MQSDKDYIMAQTTSAFSDIANNLLNGMGTDLFTKSGNLISGIAPVFQIGFGIYILLVALDAYNRGFDENVMDLGKRMVGWCLLLLLLSIPVSIKNSQTFCGCYPKI